MIASRTIRLSLVTSLLLLMSTADAHAQDGSSQAPRTVTVSGTGESTAVPDKATVRFAIETDADDAETARSQNARAARNAMNAARSFDIPEEDIRMESLRLRPRREYNRQTGKTEDLGYVALRTVRVDLSNIDDLPGMIAKVVSEGANRLEGVEYDLEDRTPIRNQALRNAAETAQSKAELLAQTLGALLGPVQQINEQSFSFPQPSKVRMEAMAMTAADASEPEPDAFAAGQITVTAQIQVSFLLE
jgi:uncharacterized protein